MRHRVVYANCTFTFKTVPHENDLRVPSPEELESEKFSPEREAIDRKACVNEKNTEGCNAIKPTLVIQSLSKDLARDLVLNKNKTDILEVLS